MTLCAVLALWLPFGGTTALSQVNGGDGAASAAAPGTILPPRTGRAHLGDRPPPASAKDEETAKARQETGELCRLMTSAARRHGVPADFFIRLIWKESRFKANAVSPAGAQGIAQFMPGTARIRGLKDPFDREEALYASASFLADLEADFGSWGLAAAGYNGGPNRVPRFVRGEAGLPSETIDYVYSITGRPAEYWARSARQALGIPEPQVGEPLEAPEDTAIPSSQDVQEPAEEIVEADGPGSESVGVGNQNGSRASLAVRVPDAAGAVSEPVVWRRRGDLSLLSPADLPTGIPAGVLPRPPRDRPHHTPRRVDCFKLVARLGRARDITPPAAGGWTRWGAQVAGHPKRAVAFRQYARLKSRLPSDLVAQGPMIVVRRFAARGRRPIHAVQFAAPNRNAAQALCKRIAKSLAPCVVVKNT
ncbi:MAG: lytic transglycosylase domain-containing protein [Pseudomonadota bacterium]